MAASPWIPVGLASLIVIVTRRSDNAAGNNTWLHRQPGQRARPWGRSGTEQAGQGRVSRRPAMPPRSARGCPRSSSCPLLSACSALMSMTHTYPARPREGATSCGGVRSQLEKVAAPPTSLATAARKRGRREHCALIRDGERGRHTDAADEPWTICATSSPIMTNASSHTETLNSHARRCKA